MRHLSSLTSPTLGEAPQERGGWEEKGGGGRREKEAGCLAMPTTFPPLPVSPYGLHTRTPCFLSFNRGIRNLPPHSLCLSVSSISSPHLPLFSLIMYMYNLFSAPFAFLVLPFCCLSPHHIISISNTCIFLLSSRRCIRKRQKKGTRQRWWLRSGRWTFWTTCCGN